MKIAVPVASYHPGTTGEYVVSAFRRMGHDADVTDAAGFLRDVTLGAHDLFFCVDSGEPLDMTVPASAGVRLDKVAFWFIDYRHNKDRPGRRPTDAENARALASAGGRVFQAQREDVESCLAAGVPAVHLPLAADPFVWSDAAPKSDEFDVAFVGNVWDEGRLGVLRRLLSADGLRAAVPRPGSLWKEAAAAFLRRAKVGFNVNSFHGSPAAFDVNMRVFETLSCGVPLVTPDVPGLAGLLPPGCPFVRTYRPDEDPAGAVRAALADAAFLGSGAAAREFVVGSATYEHRMAAVLGRTVAVPGRGAR